jgi:DNA repair photolyase
MPVMPFLTDSVDHLDRALSALREAGAASVVYGALHLRPGAREWFLSWLQQEHPALVARYRAMYRSSYAPEGYRRWLGERMRPLLRRYGFAGRPALGGTGLPLPVRGAVAAAAPPALELTSQPTLF